MPNEQVDFWPDFTNASLRTPVTLLREQAALLGPKTQQLVVADVESMASGENFYHRFYLLVPTLDNYRYELFALSHSILLYPATVSYKSMGIHIENEEALKTWLKNVLSSKETTKIIEALLAQAKRDV